MAQHVVVQVLDKNGRPKVNERVSIFATHIRQQGGNPDEWTDASGTATFDLEVDADEEVILYVRGREQVARGRLKTSYRIVT